jgi:hypothetical protein
MRGRHGRPVAGIVRVVGAHRAPTGFNQWSYLMTRPNCPVASAGVTDPHRSLQAIAREFHARAELQLTWREDAGIRTVLDGNGVIA